MDEVEELGDGLVICWGFTRNNVDIWELDSRDSGGRWVMVVCRSQALVMLKGRGAWSRWGCCIVVLGAHGQWQQ